MFSQKAAEIRPAIYPWAKVDTLVVVGWIIARQHTAIGIEACLHMPQRRRKQLPSWAEQRLSLAF
jgi:hypothetical protein